MKWLAVCLFALQATGASWFMHVTTCGESTSRAECAGVRSSPIDDPGHHASQTCDICQVLLTLRAAPPSPEAIPAAVRLHRELPPAANPFSPADVFSSIDPRGPPG